MANIKRAGIFVVAAISAALLALTASTAGAQEGDLDCGDPGTTPNMSVDPNNDPNDLDSDDDGVGCEEDGGGSAPAPAEPEAPAGDGDDDMAEPAEPVAEEPDYTG